MGEPKYLINRSILKKYMNDSIKLSIQCNLSAVDEFFVYQADGEQGEHIFIINNDAECRNPMDSEKGLTGITIYATKEPYYDPEKDEMYITVDDFINKKLEGFPEWFILKCMLYVEGLEKYKIDINKDRR